VNSVHELSIALMQMTSIDDVDSNVLQMEELLSKIHPTAKVRLACFPENCLYMRTLEGDKIHPISLSNGPITRLAAKARELNMFLHLGSIPANVNGHLYNCTVLITDRGEVKPTYQKMHLFDIHLEGQKPIRESDVFKHGHKPNVIEIDGWRLGETICYDLRFAELYSLYARQEVDAILVPSAFLVKTGEAHWDVLLRARAIESQAYVLAAAQGGTHIGKKGGVRETYGNSLVVDPWGKVISRGEASPSVVIASLTKEQIENVRRQIPMKLHRRLPLGN
jgi:deaminated glutathione amidase